MRDFINRIIKHESDTTGDYGHRMVMHLPGGLFMAFLFTIHPAAMVLFGVFILFYEIFQSWYALQGSWKDLSGYIWGYVVGMLIIKSIGGAL